ncbi:MAG: prepilin-type N-terminal cleavage/methylation domain-containing protein [Bdellovibrionales bacterium]|nr:prepilin-type N-terminal cleavage/methylation domain-containing protein [Bdellovibrionales bacterium]
MYDYNFIYGNKVYIIKKESTSKPAKTKRKSLIKGFSLIELLVSLLLLLRF